MALPMPQTRLSARLVLFGSGVGGLVAALLWGVVVAFHVVYTASSGCEDYMAACREATPVRAVLAGTAGGFAVIALATASGAGLLQAMTGRRSGIRARALRISFVALILWVAAVLSTGA